ncbi:MAG: IgGFc-binding protein, partial [Myxococcales bacterium]|nr:IgGFc-binding protein [Myxococcales bacterium]
AAPGDPPNIQQVTTVSVAPGQLEQVILPTRELDCGVAPNQYASPGTCLSSRAFRISSSAPIVVYQFNVFANAFSNDASLLLPTNALGQSYRAINWQAGHFVDPLNTGIIDRSYITIVGVEEDTQVVVKPSWRTVGNPPIPPAQPGEPITVTLGPFDVLNLETDQAIDLNEAMQPGVADLTGTTVSATKPVAVFSGVESTQAPGGVDIPTYSGWMDETCCLDHLEEQLFPLESIGKRFVLTRSPVRSTGSYKEPDVLRFVGAAEVAQVTTTLPPPFDNFTIQPGQVLDTWTDEDIVVTSDNPVLIGQLLVAQGYVDGALKGDPSLTVLPPVEQYRTEYVILTPGGWTENWVVIAMEATAQVTLDGASVGSCIVGDPVNLDGVDYAVRRCQVNEGAHALSGDKPFGITAYGYGSAGSYAFAGGADVKKIYEVPPLE